MSEPSPFRIDVPETELERLRQRLALTRWPDRETPDDWSQGVPLDYVKDVAAYWADKYDWRRCEQALNAFPQWKLDVDGLGVHFLHVPSPNENALPLVMTHGWPGSVVEFMKVIGPLSDPASHGGEASDAFHVVCPSLPGYGFSDKPTAPGWGVERIGSAWGELMARLGYDRYVAQGGDWGAAVTTSMGITETEHCAGIHLNMPLVRPTPELMENLTPFEEAALASAQFYWDHDSGYSKEQSTRPQTLGYSLADSPVGQMAWILEKFFQWTDCDGHPENVLTRDEILDDIMMYWLTNSGASSARLYWQSFGILSAELLPVPTPTGVSIFPKEIFRASKRWVESRYTDLIYFNTLDKGGHFAAFEQPETFVREVREAFRALR